MKAVSVSVHYGRAVAWDVVLSESADVWFMRVPLFRQSGELSGGKK